MTADWTNAAQPWLVDLICCGYSIDRVYCTTWEEANEWRETFTSGVAVDSHGFSGTGHNGHRRAGIVRQNVAALAEQEGRA